MEVNNISKIRDLLKFNEKDDYYFIQLIQRRKDNLGMECDARGIKSYYVSSLRLFDSLIPEIKKLSYLLNARVYIHINPRNYRYTSIKVATSLMERCNSNDLIGCHTVFDRVSSKYSKPGIRNSKLWVVDVDDINIPGGIDELVKSINEKCSPSGDKVIDVLPTVSGTHIITRPFNSYEFREIYPDSNMVELSKSEKPTLLYYKPSEDNYIYHPLITRYGGNKVKINIKLSDENLMTLSGKVLSSSELREYYTKNWKDYKRPKSYVPMILVDGLESAICINRVDNNFYSWIGNKGSMIDGELIINEI